MKFLFSLRLIFLLFIASQLQAQVGNDNPTGPAGIFNGEITTAGSYDPYTGTVMRSITDISVAGAVGTTPLTLTRIYNSRQTPAASSFGAAGSWTHNYSWSCAPSTQTTCSTCLPTDYKVSFPDGRVEDFVYSSSDIYFRAAAGTTERFIPLNGSLLAYLILSDGSKVELKGTKQTVGSPAQYYYTYVAQALIDPYGLRTTLTYNVRGGTLATVTEPAGRTLQFTYTTIGGSTVIDHVTASDGRTVQYYYIQSAFSPGTTSYVCLDHVVYYGDATWTAHYKYCAPNTGGANGIPLLWTADDPMYVGPMRRIGYVYQTTTNTDGSSPVYGQVLSENYYDGTNVGTALTSLSVIGSLRKETRADGNTRTFSYAVGHGAGLTSCTDFRAKNASQVYDGNNYIASVTDRNGHTTNFTRNALTGAVLTTTFPSTPNDTPPGTPRGVVTTTYGSASCPDPNNRDANNPYYPYSVTDEGSNTTVFLRDTNKRVTTINYPDGGTESFTYNSFGEVLTHVLKSGGTEAFSYDARGLKQTYRDPYHVTGNPTAWYQYDSLDRLSGVTDALGNASGDVNHTTSFAYNARGQLATTTLPTDPIDGIRHTIQKAYNPNGDGTLISVTDQLGHVTSYTYDDYRRPRSVTTPGHNTPVTAYSYYDANGTGNDYTHADANVTFTTSPGGEKTQVSYDANLRKMSVIAAENTSDAAKTSYAYDNVGNVASVISPNEQPGQPYAGQSTVMAYDERNRLMSVTDPLGNITSCTYDAAGRKATATRANGQATTFDSYDSMNRLLQQTVKQTPNPDAVTKYTYYASGLLHTMQDPRLVANNSSYANTYSYDQMGRKASLTYPADSNNVQRSEAWHYDVAGRVDTYTNRAGKVMTNSYDALNRRTSATWNDGGLTPTVTFAYDVASRVTSIINANATIVRSYFNDNLLSSETTTYADNTPRTINYTYNSDGNRATIQYPNGAYSFTYSYTNRNQLLSLINNAGNGTIATYGYDLDGNLLSRTPDNGATSAYTYDGLDRVTHISHNFTGGARTFDYAYDSVSNRNWVKRDGGTGDVFGYDLGDQSTSILLDVANPDTTSPGGQTINCDANGNRTVFSAYGPVDAYTTNDLNQYTNRNSFTATYDDNGNLIIGFDGSTYTYDAQNRLLSAIKAGATEAFTYDGLNRQVSRTIGAASPIYNVYDGWNLVGEYAPAATSPSTAYLGGAGGLVKNLTTNNYYYQDASGSTSHLADGTGALIEWYRYDLQGTPVFYDASNTQISTSVYGVRHLFTGQQWYNDVGLYDLRNRYYSPDIGRFLQSDPVGFSGDASNIYRYCGNNPTNLGDPMGTFPFPLVFFGGFYDAQASRAALPYVEGAGIGVGLVGAFWLNPYAGVVGLLAVAGVTVDTYQLTHGENPAEHVEQDNNPETRNLNEDVEYLYTSESESSESGGTAASDTSESAIVASPFTGAVTNFYGGGMYSSTHYVGGLQSGATFFFDPYAGGTAIGSSAPLGPTQSGFYPQVGTSMDPSNWGSGGGLGATGAPDVVEDIPYHPVGMYRNGKPLYIWASTNGSGFGIGMASKGTRVFAVPH